MTQKTKLTPEQLRKVRREAGKKGAAARIVSLKEHGYRKPLDTVALVKEIEREGLEQFYMRGIRGVATAQMALAKGLTYLYVIRTDKKGNRSKPEVVEDTHTIEQYLADELDNDDEEYYFMATKEPHNEALKNIQDRVFGKPTETRVLDVTHNFSLVELGAKRGVVHLPASEVQVLPPPQDAVAEAILD